jgi:hypothetical protein
MPGSIRARRSRRAGIGLAFNTATPEDAETVELDGDAPAGDHMRAAYQSEPEDGDPHSLQDAAAFGGDRDLPRAAVGGRYSALGQSCALELIDQRDFISHLR